MGIDRIEIYKRGKYFLVYIYSTTGFNCKLKCDKETTMETIYKEAQKMAKGE